jgi:Protein of unknown function (DUF998)
MSPLVSGSPAVAPTSPVNRPPEPEDGPRKEGSSDAPPHPQPRLRRPLSAAVVAVNPQWNPLTRQLSEYALGRHGWLQIAAFLAAALAYGALAVAVRDRVRGLAARIGLIVLCACALGSVGVGVFITDPMTTPRADWAASSRRW